MASALRSNRVLFVSISFPPKNDPECLQAAKYFKYLKKFPDLSLTVVTSTVPTLFMPYDAQLEKYGQGYDQKIEVPIIENKLVNFLLRRILPSGIEYPDSKFTFHWQKNKVIRKLKIRPDVIYSRSSPLSSTLMAYKLAMHYKVPWVMHLSDPWVDSPAKNYTTREAFYQSKWEQLCFERASAVCLTSSHTVDFYRKKYPSLETKLHLFPNVYDPDDFSEQELIFSEKLKITYTGGLAGERSAKNFLQACKELMEEKPNLINSFEVIFAGPMDRKNREIFAANKLLNVKHVGELPHSTALELIKGSHVLLNIDLPVQDPKMAMFFASKLLDYFLAKRTILSLTSRGSASEQVLEKVNATVLMLDDVVGIKAFIAKAIDAHQRADIAFFTLDSNTDEFSAEINSKRLAQLLRQN